MLADMLVVQQICGLLVSFQFQDHSMIGLLPRMPMHDEGSLQRDVYHQKRNDLLHREMQLEIRCWSDGVDKQVDLDWYRGCDQKPGWQPSQRRAGAIRTKWIV